MLLLFEVNQKLIGILANHSTKLGRSQVNKSLKPLQTSEYIIAPKKTRAIVNLKDNKSTYGGMIDDGCTSKVGTP